MVQAQAKAGKVPEGEVHVRAQCRVPRPTVDIFNILRLDKNPAFAPQQSWSELF